MYIGRDAYASNLYISREGGTAGRIKKKHRGGDGVILFYGPPSLVSSICGTRKLVYGIFILYGNGQNKYV